MIKWKEIAGPSCLTAADINEPVFVLRANDELAPGIVREWAYRYLLQKQEGYDGPGAIQPSQLSKHKEALALADQMEAWRRLAVETEVKP